MGQAQFPVQSVQLVEEIGAVGEGSAHTDLWNGVARHLDGNKTAEDLAEMLLREAGVAVVPGEAFGMQHHIRISYALPEMELISGFERMAEVL